jgi:hypothetical protein
MSICGAKQLYHENHETHENTKKKTLTAETAEHAEINACDLRPA